MTTPDRPVRFRSSGLSPRKPTHFAFHPDQAGRENLARGLGLLEVANLRFAGSITPVGRDEYKLTGDLHANVVQACVVTLGPVPAEVSEQVIRRYVAMPDVAPADEMEIPEDISVEPMPEIIDLFEVVSEAIALALPLYPRAPGAEMANAGAAPEGVTPLSDSDLKPFAGLAGLAEKLGGSPQKDGSDKG